jgi:chromosome segregation ATPase
LERRCERGGLTGVPVVDDLNKRLEEMYTRVQNADKVTEAAVSKMREVQTSMSAVRQHSDDLDSQNTKLLAENKSQEEAIAALQAEIKLRDGRLDEQTAIIAEQRTTIDKMSEKLAVAKDIDGLNVREFETLMSSNLQVADNIQRLMATFSRMQAVAAAAPAPQAEGQPV